MSEILVTGGAGFIGSHGVPALLEAAGSHKRFFGCSHIQGLFESVSELWMLSTGTERDDEYDKSGDKCNG